MEVKQEKIETLRSNETPIYRLSPNDQEKWRKLGTYGYTHCPQTLKRLGDINTAVFDSKLDLIFLNKEAQIEYYKENGLGRPREDRPQRKNKYKGKKQYKSAA